MAMVWREWEEVTPNLERPGQTKPNFPAQIRDALIRLTT